MISGLLQQIINFVVSIVPVPALDSIIQQLSSGVVGFLQSVGL